MDAFPVWIVVAHFLNILFMTLLARSGLEVLSAFPKLYLHDDCMPGGELVRFTRKRFAPAAHPTWSSLEEEESWSSAIALPGRKNLGLGRHWHFLTIEFWILTGVVYVALLFATGEWRRLVPTEWSVVPDALRAMATYLSGELVPPRPHLPYNAAQQLAYFLVVFVLAPLQILTGAAMSPSVIGRFPWYPRLFGGRQAARTLHFAGLCTFAAFVVVHTAMVIVHGLGHELAAIVLTSYDADHALALVVGGAGLLGVALVNAAATIFSLRRPRAAQRLIARLVDPLERLLVRRLRSRQRYRSDQISPFFRVNGHPPADDAYRALAREHFRGYRLIVSGLVAAPLQLSLGELRALGAQRQVTLHNCIQGWTNVAEWSGVPLSVVLELCRPLAEARYVVFHALDDKGQTEGEGRFGYYYGTLPLSLARRPQTILALDMNGRPLPVEHGAPVRLRLETQLGFKMVKWIRAIELIEDPRSVGMGMGGWREDQQYYTTFAGI
jgi:DMSO/TMAO reductase YedYZ molybdopterin-dependent catalytic subunit/thiosulfate reductase cytochrome b subunit